MWTEFRSPAVVLLKHDSFCLIELWYIIYIDIHL